MAQPQAAGFRAPTVAHSGNDFAARKRLENMATAASSITNTERWGGKGASRNPAVQAYEAAVKADLQAQGLQPDVDTEVMGFNANLMREQMSQDGATQRTFMQEAGADRRDGRRSLVEMARLGMDQETQGFANRAAAQQEQLRNTLINPNATPEQRAVAQRSLAALAGKTAADRMQTVTLPDTTNDMGQVVRGGQALVRLMEDGSVQQVPVSASRPTGAASSVQREVGTVSRVGNKEAVWDGSKWVPRQ